MNSSTCHEKQLDFVIPTYYKTADNVTSIVNYLANNSESTKHVKFYIILDHDDPATGYVFNEAIKSLHDVKVIISQDFVDEDAFNHGFSQCPWLKIESRKWFWQQFIKLLSYEIEGIGEFIVLWDGDTFPCGSQRFFYNDIPIATPSLLEYHVPYFLTFSNLTGHNSFPPFSFICQYASVLKNELKELASIFQGGIYEGSQIKVKGPLDQKKYFQRIFTNLCNASDIQQVFSEYESIALYRMMSRSPFLIQKKKHFRHGGLLPLPRGIIIELVKALGFTNVSFESRHFAESFRVNQFLRKIKRL
jgi:hypothetical protein